MEQKPDISSAAGGAKTEDAHLWVNLKVKNQVGGAGSGGTSLIPRSDIDSDSDSDSGTGNAGGDMFSN
jgi:hypothetical protein